MGFFNNLSNMRVALGNPKFANGVRNKDGFVDVLPNDRKYSTDPPFHMMPLVTMYCIQDIKCM